MDFRNVYITKGSACKPGTALSLVTKAKIVWSESSSVVGQLSEAFHVLKLTRNFIGEMTIDSLCCVSRPMLHSANARALCQVMVS